MVTRWRPVVIYKYGLSESVMRFPETYATKQAAIQGGKATQREWEALNPTKKGGATRITAVPVGMYSTNKEILKVIREEKKFEFGL